MRGNIVLKRTVMAALAALAISAPAYAVDDGLYLGIGGGVSFTQDVGWDASVPGISASGDIGLNVGFGVLGALGYQWKNGFGVEGEIGYRRNNADDLTATVAIPAIGVAGTGTFSASGSVSALSFMANGRYGFDTGTQFTPFVMAGIGVARVAANSISAAGVEVLDDSAWVFAYQAGGGVNVGLGQGFSAEVSYRFFGTQDATFNSGGVDVNTDGLKNHSVFVVLKYAFGGATP
jgi:opacity protein-like surface antigen